MKKLALGEVTVDELVERFVNLCVAQDRELLRGDIARVNRLFDDIEAVKQELKARPGDQRRALIPLYQHENMQVRLKAAKATLAIAPVAARQELEDIKASNWSPQSSDASSSLWNLDRGIFKPM
jgi:hypothetical protein